ncbi:WG repeat-containing protein [Cytophaga aurantiaca]|uniref:WG repeat-containing protein n=1 Tax=Cytophaga aurantiaca TaxID=29530 RepID=UPI000373B6B5|nr:WG repeat-containing protein [Cytophaga aurantiaca]
MKFIQKIICIFLVSLSILANAQEGNSCPEDLFPYYDKEKKAWGYADMMGMMVVEPIFTKVSPYSSNKAIVQKGSLCGVLDCNGNLIIPVQYKKILNFRYNKAWAMKDSLWALIDDKGRNVLAPQYSEIYSIQGTELTWVKKAGLWGLFDEENSKYIIIPQYTVAQVMSPNCSLIQKNGKLGVVNHVNGGFLLEPNIEHVKKISPRDIIFEQDGKWGIFNNIGKVTLNPLYDSIDVFKTSILIVKNGANYGLTDLAGGILLPAEYQSIAPYSNGYFRIKKNNLYGYASIKGKVYITPKYPQASDFSNGTAIVQQNNLFGIIDLKDFFVIKPIYTSLKLSDTKEYYVGSEKANTENLLLPVTSNIFNTYTFDKVSLTDSLESIQVNQNNVWFYFNGKNQAKKFDIVFDETGSFSNGIATVKKDGKVGIINSAGAYVMQPNYSAIEKQQLGITSFYIATENNKKGLFNADGKRILASDYQEIILAAPNHLKVKKDNVWSLLRTDGTVVSTQVYTFMDTGNATPIPVTRSKKWCLLNQDGVETKLIKAVSIKQDPTNARNYIVDTGKSTYIINKLGEKQ